MSDADNQMGGTGGDTGAPPGAGKSPAGEAAKEAGRSGDERDPGRGEEDRVTEDSKESFPASDPPGHY